MSQIFYLPFQPVFNSRGLPVAGAKATFFASGTTTKQAVYADAALTTPLANPVIADSIGKLPDIYMPEDSTYRVRITSPGDAQLGADIDPYYPGQAFTVVPNLPEIIAPDGSNLVGYRAQGAGNVSQTIQDTVNRERLNLYDKVPKNLWAGIEAGNGTTDLTSYVLAALGTGRGVNARAGTYRAKLNITAALGQSIRGEGKQRTYFENVDNDPIVTLDSSAGNIVGFELEDMWLQNRDPVNFTTCDLLKITGAGDGEAFQNDQHHFRNVWFFQGRDNIACYKRAIWITFDGCNSTGAQRDAIHIETVGNVNQWEFKGRTILKGAGRNGLFFKHDFPDLATGWTMDNVSTEDSGSEGWRFTGDFGIQGFGVRGCTFENNARLIAAGSSATVDGIRRRKANIFADAKYIAGLDINTTTFYNNGGGGSGGNPDQHIYVEATGAIVQSGAIANCRFLPTQTGNDVTWPIGLAYHNNNVNSGTVLLDDTRQSIDLRKFTPQDEIAALLQLTGVTTSPTGTARYVKQGALVTAYIPEITATSNSTAATLIGLPVSLRPARAQTVPCIIQDAGAGVGMGLCTVQTDGTLTLFKDVGGGAFANTGTKGVKLQTLTWALS